MERTTLYFKNEDANVTLHFKRSDGKTGTILFPSEWFSNLMAMDAVYMEMVKSDLSPRALCTMDMNGVRNKALDMIREWTQEHDVSSK